MCIVLAAIIDTCVLNQKQKATKVRTPTATCINLNMEMGLRPNNLDKTTRMPQRPSTTISFQQADTGDRQQLQPVRRIPELPSQVGTHPDGVDTVERELCYRRDRADRRSFRVVDRTKILLRLC